MERVLQEIEWPEVREGVEQVTSISSANKMAENAMTWPFSRYSEDIIFNFLTKIICYLISYGALLPIFRNAIYPNRRK